MASQYTKRKNKENQPKLGEELVKAITEIAENPTAQDIVFSNSGFDVFFDKVDRKHKVAVLEYNPETGFARVKEIADITRGVALKYDLDKKSFNVLVKRKVRK